MYVTEFDSVLFVEGRPDHVEAIGQVHVKLGGVLTQAQLKSLADVKREMAAKVRSMGGNAVVDFQYGQKSVGWLASILNLDDVSWHGSGTVVRLTGTQATSLRNSR